MATSDETNTTEFARFSTLLEYQRQAIILRSSGKTWPEVRATINSQFSLDYAEDTVRQWFGPGAPLEAAFDEYNDMLAEQAIKTAKQSAKKLQAASIATMGEMMSEKHDDSIRLQAAWRLANKYIPDRQITVNEPGDFGDIPPELLAAGEAIVNGQPDDPPTSEPADIGAGASGGEAVSTELLQQSGEPERPSDPPA